MAQLPTDDPFGYVGCYVLRHPQRNGRRRQRSVNTNSMKPDPGVAAEGLDEEEEEKHEGENGMELRGWVTRYDVRLDAYTLFQPSTSTTTLYTRGEVMQFLSNPEFQLRKTHDAAFPPPLEDTRSRFVDAPVRKAVPTSSQQQQQTTNGRVAVAVEVEGRVVCFLPFMNSYCVAFDDESTVEMSESEVVDALLLYAKRSKETEKESAHEEGATQTTATATTATDAEMQAETEESKGRKRRRSEDFTPNTTAGDVEDDGEETEDEEPPPELLRSAAVKREAASAALASEVEVPPPRVVDSVALEPPRATVDDGRADVKMQSVAEVDPNAAWEQSPASAEPNVAIAEETHVLSAPVVAETPAEEDVGIPAAMDDDMEEPIDIPTPEDEEDEDEEMQAVTAALASTTTTTAQAAAEPSTVDLTEVVEGYSASTPSLPLPLPLHRPVQPPGPPPLSYIVDATPHVPTAPLDKRSMAFEFVRTELTRLIESEECARLEIKLVADVLSNRDIKDRDAIRRFVETGGLVAVNRVLNVRSSDALATKTQRYDRVLFALKLLAMLPTPSEQQVMESVIGKTIGRFIKSRLTDQQTQADPQMPKCIPQLAKWIKHKWVANMQRSGMNPPKAQQEARRKPTVTQTNKFPSSSTTSDAFKASKKHMQRPTHGRPPGQRSNDPVPIPRLASRTPPSVPMPPPPPPVLSFTAAASAAPSAAASSGDSQSSRWQPAPAKSSLKPDWIRQKEALSRSRFTIGTDANAERQHYQQRERANATAHSNAATTTNSSTASGPRPIPSPLENPGDRGVFGRTQRLSFGPRWNVCEFFKDAPPSAVRRVASTASSSTYNRGQAGSSGSGSQPKSILRRASKYCDELRFGV